MIELLGIIATILFAISSIPLVIKTIKDGHARNIPITSALTVATGSWLMLTYLILKNNLDLVVLADFGLTSINWTIILLYKIFKK
jgi:uncharacterized protein with PQ loop repeat